MRVWFARLLPPTADAGGVHDRKRTIMVLSVFAFWLVFTSCTQTEVDVADVVFLGGTVWSGIEGDPTARALALRNGRVLAIGSDAEIRSHAGPATEVVALDGRSVLPGFVDAHTHFISGGFQLSSVDLRDASTPEEFNDETPAFYSRHRVRICSHLRTGGRTDLCTDQD